MLLPNDEVIGFVQADAEVAKRLIGCFGEDRIPRIVAALLKLHPGAVHRKTAWKLLSSIKVTDQYGNFVGDQH